MRANDFRWNDWNLDHATRHGVSVAEIEGIVNRGRHSPRDAGNGKWRIDGRGRGDRPIRVIFLLNPDGGIYVIHAMPTTRHRRR